jgi:hypothetical protein
MWVTGHCEVLRDYSKLRHVDDLWTPVVALLNIYSDKYPYKVTISYPYNLHFHVQPPFFSFSLMHCIHMRRGVEHFPKKTGGDGCIRLTEVI